MNTALCIMAWGVTTWRMPSAHRSPWKRAAWHALAALAVALTAARPSVAAAIDQATGVAGLHVLVEYLAGIAGCSAVLGLVACVNHPARTHSSRGRRTVAAAALMITFTVLFFLTRRPGSAAFTTAVIAYHGYMAMAMTSGTQMFWQASRDARHVALRTGLCLLAVGTAASMVYASWQIAFLTVKLTGLVPALASHALTASALLEQFAILAIITGTTVPAAGEAWRALADYTSLQALRPLRDSLIAAVPEIATTRPWLPATPRTRIPHEPRLHLIRCAADICDSALLLRHYTSDATISRARTLLTGCGLAGPRLEAATAACWLELAAASKRRGVPSSQPCRQTLPGGSALGEEIAWLRMITSARRSPHVQAVSAQLDRDTAPVPARWR